MTYVGDQKREYQLAWMKKRRDTWIESKGGVCARCPSVNRLEVDHIDRTTKSMDPSAIWSRRQEIRDAELAKCQVLCYDCHLAKSLLELPEWKGVLSHGTHSMYVSKKCRCAPCTKAHATLARTTRSSGGKW